VNSINISRRTGQPRRGLQPPELFLLFRIVISVAIDLSEFFRREMANALGESGV
jgi:hypothetical protein